MNLPEILQIVVSPIFWGFAIGVVAAKSMKSGNFGDEGDAKLVIIISTFLFVGIYGFIVKENYSYLLYGIPAMFLALRAGLSINFSNIKDWINKLMKGEKHEHHKNI